MTSVSGGRIALALGLIFSVSMAGCGGGGLEEVPKDAPYVAPPTVGAMKPAPRQKAPKGGVPLTPGAPR